MSKRKYDFAGWVTKNDIRCADGVTIKHNAFKHQDGQKVPLVWNHGHKDIQNILGHVELKNDDAGVYGYGYFNHTDDAQHAKEMIKHGDISAMSIGANRIKRKANDVIHGLIYEVSLVLSGANPGALIESVVTHGDNGQYDEEAIITTGTLIHSADDILDLQEEEEGENELYNDNLEHKEKTIGDVLGTLNEEQTEALEALVANILAAQDDEDDSVEQNYHEEGGSELKHNVFEGTNTEKDVTTLQHSDVLDIFERAKKNGSFKEALQETTLEHGITNIETLFPEAKWVEGAPFVNYPRDTAASKIVDGARKSPFSKVKTIHIDLTEDDARARGYIKGNEKIEQIFEILHRETGPQTVYKKQGLDRDDIIDITDFDVVGFINQEMKVMLKEEIGRAILIGDGREISDESKIKENKIRPIVSDDDLYTIKRTASGVSDIIEQVIKVMSEYDGTGQPSMYMSPARLAELRLLKKNDGSFLFGEIPSAASIASRLGVKEIVPSTFLTNQIVLVNMADYTIGATKGGEVTTFDDFDIDFNKYKYLIETRLSGALVKPKSAAVITITEEPEVDPEV